MLKRLSRKLVILSVLVAALTAVPSAPTSKRVFCQEAPLEAGCPTNYWCCDYDGNCTCAPPR